MPTELLEPRAPAAPTALERAPKRDPVLHAVAWLVETPAEIYLTATRLILGGVLLAHAAQKVFGWFGGAGFSATVESFRAHFAVPSLFAVLAILAEFAGALGLILGFLGRAAAVCVVAVMVGAILLVHVDNGFFMNWSGAGRGEGLEYHLVAIAAALPILAKGSGASSVDGWLGRLLDGHLLRT